MNDWLADDWLTPSTSSSPAQASAIVQMAACFLAKSTVVKKRGAAAGGKPKSS